MHDLMLPDLDVILAKETCAAMLTVIFSDTTQEDVE